MYTHRITDTYQTDAGQIASVQSAYTGDTEVGYDGTIAANATNVAVNINAVHLNIQALCIYSTVAISIKMNSSSAPTQTINVAAGQEINWGIDHPEPCPITADVTTGMFISNATANPATVKIRILVNP
jgi:hypothetical protein